MLNEPIPQLTNRSEADDWNPLKGTARGLLWGAVTAVILALVLAIPAWYAPPLTLNWLLRTAIAFIVTLILFKVVHGTAAMAGGATTLIVVVYAILVMLSQHVVFAVHGMPSTRGANLAGWDWCHPLVLAFCNVSTVIGMGFCVVLCRHGEPITGTIADLLKLRLG